MVEAEDTYIDQHRRSSSFMDESGNLVVHISDLPDNRTCYKEDPNCICCNNSSWSLLSKKNYCRFCYHTVCKDCSLNRIKHPETLKMSRCCNLCYSKFISSSVLSKVNDEKMANKLATKKANDFLERETSKRRIEGANKQNMEAEIVRRRQGIEDKKEEYAEDIKRKGLEVTKLESDLRNLQDQLQTKKRELASTGEHHRKVTKDQTRAMDKLQDLTSNITYTKEHLSQLQDDYSQLRRMQEERSVWSSPDAKRANSKSFLAEMQTKLDILKEQQQAITRDNQYLREQIHTSSQHLASLKQPPTRIPSSTSSDSSDTLSSIFLTYIELKQDNETLKKELALARGEIPEYRDVEVEKLKRDLLKYKEDNTEIRVQLNEYLRSPKRSSTPKPKKKCTVF